MSNLPRSQTAQLHDVRWRWLKPGGLIAALFILNTLGIFHPEPRAIAQSATESQPQQGQSAHGWDAVLSTARLINAEQQETALVVQLKVNHKPQTTYANAIYQVYAQVQGRWLPVYTNTGARLIESTEGQTILPPEVILLSDMQRVMGRGVNWGDVELRTVVTLRYDLRDGQSNQEIVWEETQLYSAIAVTTTPDIVGSTYR